jgi:hypothetical protein
MANNKVKVDVEVTDNGTLKQVGNKANKAAKDLDGVAQGSRNTDRALKGTAQASSNSTKNFSKMAQGINGGLVPAYATLAANLFAVSAAFNFLKDAGNLVTLQAGQAAYAGATGVALKSLTNDIIAATDAQINFTDASQAAAIGTASGLSTDQLTRLGTAAKDASLILGRDVTDSFNRLVRGVTKAEPELLDELGIILRLDNATREYADALGLSQKDLTEFQRSQAVANNVLDQAERKYSKIIAVVNPGVNTFNKLGKSFDDIINKIKEFAAVTLGPFAEAISQFPLLGVALLGVFGKGVLTAALPGLRDIGNTARESAEKATESYEKSKAALKSYTTEMRVANKEAAAQRAQALGDPGFKTTKPGSGFDLISKGRGADLSSQQLSGMKRAVANSKTLTKEMKANWTLALDEMLLATKKSTKGIQQEFKKTQGFIGVAGKKIAVGWNLTMATMKGAVASFAGFAATALSVISWVSLAATLGVVVYQFFKTKKEADETSKALDYAGEKVSSLTEEFKNFNEIQRILLEEGGTGLEYFTNLGTRIGAVQLPKLEPLFDLGLENFAKFQESNLENIKDLEISVEKAATTLANREDRLSGIINRGGINAYGQAAQSINKAAKDLKGLRQELADTDKTFGEFLNTSDDQRLKDLGKTLTDQAANLSVLNNQFADGSSKSIRAYLETLNELVHTKGLSIEKTQELLTQLKQEQSAVQEATLLFKNYARALEDTKTQSNQLRTGFLNVTAAESAVIALKALVKETEALRNQNGKLTDEQKIQLGITERNLQFAEALDNVEKNKIRRANALAVISEKSLRGQTKGQATLIQRELKSQELSNNRKYVEEQINILYNERENQNGKLNNQEQTRLQALEQELELINQQNISLERSANNVAQLYDSANQGLESSVQKNIAAVIKGEEKNLKDAIVNIGKGVLNGIADTLSTQLTDLIMGTNPLQIAQMGAVTVAYALTEGAAAVGAAIRSAMGAEPAAFVGPPEPSIIEDVKKKKQGSISRFLLGSKGTTSVEDDQGVLAEKTERRGGLFSPIIRFFSNSENPFFKGLTGLFSKENPLLKGFGSIFGSLFQGLGSLLGGGGGIASLFTSFLGFAKGGMAPGGFRAYANGGIVSKPTLGMVGEGRHNEAIVPLPNGSSIPVEMKGSGQQNNNVTVNVSVDNQGNASTNSQQDSAQAGNLGQVIARAVQQELQNQKRSGGILSPYGAA